MGSEALSLEFGILWLGVSEQRMQVQVEEDRLAPCAVGLMLVQPYVFQTEDHKQYRHANWSFGLHLLWQDISQTQASAGIHFQAPPLLQKSQEF